MSSCVSPCARIGTSEGWYINAFCINMNFRVKMLWKPSTVEGGQVNQRNPAHDSTMWSHLYPEQGREIPGRDVVKG